MKALVMFEAEPAAVCRLPAEQAETGEGQAAGAAEIQRLRAGDVCPVCRVGRMDYDGLLNLVCERCGAHGGVGGCFT